MSENLLIILTLPLLLLAAYRGHTRRKNGRKELKCFEKRRMSRRMRRRAAHLYKASSRRPSAKCIDNSAPTAASSAPRAPWELLSDIFTWSTPSRHSRLYSKLFQNSTHRVTRLKNWCVDNVQNYYFFSILFWWVEKEIIIAYRTIYVISMIFQKSAAIVLQCHRCRKSV